MTELSDLTHLYSGKVRDLYQFPDRRLLVVASDRISAYDHVLPTTIPDKGKILTALSLWWFDRLSSVVGNHLMPWTDDDVPAEVRGRAMVCRRLDMFPVECVARGYLAGSGLQEYRATGRVCGVVLPHGLTEASRLPEPIFTPATKGGVGEHDENVDLARVAGLIGREDASLLERLTLRVYAFAEATARDRGIIVADTKLEFGRDASTGEVLLADEVLTPDSSRFWPTLVWEPGRRQPSYDKQELRDWLRESGWDRRTPPPALPRNVVERTRARYLSAYRRLTGQDLP